MSYLENIEDFMDDAKFLKRLSVPQPGREGNLTRTEDPKGEEKEFNWERGVTDGLAENGGLYVLKELPSPFTPKFIEELLPQLETHQVSALILRRIIPRSSISDEELVKFTKEAHDFGIPMEDITEAFQQGTLDKVLVAWLDQGDTASFKDFAAGIIGQLMEWWCEANGTPKNIIVATSGDTGVAIANAFKTSKWITVTILYPDRGTDKDGNPTRGVQPEQEKQMIYMDQKYSNITCLPIKGTFDDAQNYAVVLQNTREQDATPENIQALIDAVSKNTENVILTEEQAREIIEGTTNLNLTSANSINIFRLLPQITQFFKSYGDAVRNGLIKTGQEIVFAIPTGNVGHIMAGLYAQEMGLPVKKFILGTNENNIMANFVNKGILQQDEFVNTESNSMDIKNPSNLKRMLDLMEHKCGGRGQIDMIGLKKALSDNNQVKKGIDVRDYGVTEEMLTWIQERVYANSANDEETIAAIKTVHDKTNGASLLDAHGAAVKVSIDKAAAEGLLEGETILLFETANPHKTPGTIKKAGIDKIPDHYAHAGMAKAIENVPDVEKVRRATVTSIHEVYKFIEENAEASAKHRLAA